MIDLKGKILSAFNEWAAEMFRYGDKTKVLSGSPGFRMILSGLTENSLVSSTPDLLAGKPIHKVMLPFGILIVPDDEHVFFEGYETVTAW